MKKLTLVFDKLDKDVTALSYFAAFLFFSNFVCVIWFVYHRDFSEISKYSGSLVVLFSVLLASKAASRQLAHNKITIIDDRIQDIVRITHHLIAVITDLKSRVHHSSELLKKDDYPLLAFTKNAIEIEKRFEVFFDRELYRFLNPKSVELIAGMAGTIFGLSVLSEGLAGKDNITSTSKISNIESSARGNVAKALTGLLEELESLEKEIRQIRESIDNPQ